MPRAAMSVATRTRQDAVLEAGERPLALGLALVAVDRRRRDADLVEPAHDPVGAVLGAGEDEDALDRRIAQDVAQQRLLGAGVDEDHLLLDPLGRGGDGRHRDLDRIGQVLAREAGDVLRHGGREEQALPLLGQHLHDALEGVDEAEVEHLVGLVEDEDLDALQRQRAPLDQVDQPARGGDQDVDARGERPLLTADGDAAEHHRGGVGQVAAVIAERFGDLVGELAGGREHQHPAAAARGAAVRERQAVQDRQREGRGLAGAGLGDAAEVAARHGRRDRLGLDRGRRDVAGLAERPQHGLGEAEISELGQGCIRCSRTGRAPRGPRERPL